MCFAPYVSFSTFAIEFLLAMFFLWQNPKDKLNRIIALLSLLLGIYQLNEFLICATGLNIFTRLAIITTAVLPAISISYALVLVRRKIRYYWHLLIYSPAVYFMLTFAFSSIFGESAICRSVFIEYPGFGFAGDAYGWYYYSYILASTILILFFSKNTKSNHEKLLQYMGLFGLLLFTIPTIMFLHFVPSLYPQFPSVLCEFALLLALDFMVIIWYKAKHRIVF